MKLCGKSSVGKHVPYNLIVQAKVFNLNLFSGFTLFLIVAFAKTHTYIFIVLYSKVNVQIFFFFFRKVYLHSELPHNYTNDVFMLARNFPVLIETIFSYYHFKAAHKVGTCEL